MSEKTEYTQGPWTVEHHGGPWHLFGAGDERIGTFSTSIQAHTAEQFAKAEANARLIAAAPELLEALKTMTEDLEARWDMRDHRTNPGIVHYFRTGQGRHRQS